MRRQMAHQARPSILGLRRSRRDVGGGSRGSVGRSSPSSRHASSRGLTATARRRQLPGIWLAAVGLAGLGLVATVALTAGAAIAGPSGPFGRQAPGPEGEVAAATSIAEPAPGTTAPPCTQGDVLTADRDPDDWAITILDTSLMLGDDAAPSDLVPVTESGIKGRGKVRALVIDDLRALAHAARSDGVSISVDSAYRSYAQQVAAFTSYVKGYGEAEALRTVARPGHSEHQLGTTIDFAGDLDWLAANAPAFGFVLSYPAASSPDRTCYRAESWHFRYVGRREALQVQASGLSLREWLWLHRP